MRLIINADDFGITSGSNNAICDLAEAGSLTSTTVMVNQPGVVEVPRLLEYPNLGIGLHFNLTEGRPVSDPSDVPGLVDTDGSFAGKRAIKERQKHGAVTSTEVLRELKAQYRKLHELIGNRVDHLDSHQGLNKISVVNRALLQFGRESAIPALRVYNKYYLRRLGDKIVIQHPRLGDVRAFGLKRVLVEWVLRQRTRRLEKYYQHPDGLLLARSHVAIDVFRTLAEARKSIRPNRYTLEIPFHPATNTEGLGHSKLTSQRVDEYRFLMSPEFRKAARSFDLCNYGHMARTHTL